MPSARDVALLFQLVISSAHSVANPLLANETKIIASVVRLLALMTSFASRAVNQNLEANFIN